MIKASTVGIENVFFTPIEYAESVLGFTPTNISDGNISIAMVDILDIPAIYMTADIWKDVTENIFYVVNEGWG